MISTHGENIIDLNSIRALAFRKNMGLSTACSHRKQLETSRIHFSPLKHRALSSPTHRGNLADAASANLANRSWLKLKWDVIKHEAHRYWVGTKLLGIEIMICVRILRQVGFTTSIPNGIPRFISRARRSWGGSLRNTLFSRIWTHGKPGCRYEEREGERERESARARERERERANENGWLIAFDHQLS